MTMNTQGRDEPEVELRVLAEHDCGIERHLDEIERQVRIIRGDPVDNTPWDYAIPTGRDLRQLRERCGLSREEVGELLDYTPMTISNCENGSQAPGREFIQKTLRLYKREWPRP